MDTGREVPSRMYAGILVCSVGVLMQEILLTRIFSFTIWYHLAYLTIGTALLGFGAAGSIAATQPRLVANHARAAAWCAAGAGVVLLLAMAILAPHPMSPNRILQEPGRFSLALLGYYVAITLPFLLAGLAVVLPLAAYPRHVNRLYAADLFGAGLGCAAAVVALSFMDGAAAIVICAAVFLLAGACYAPERRLALGLGTGALLLVGLSSYADRALDFRPTETKALGTALKHPGTEMLFTRWSPVNRVDLYRSAGRVLPFWAGGSQRGYRGRLPQTISIQYDGHNGTDVYRAVGDSLKMLDGHFLQTPYVLLDSPRVLVIGVGGGIDVLNALRRGASHVTGVDLQPITIELHKGMLNEWSGGAFDRPEVELVAAEGRHFVRASNASYDLIQITAVDTFSAQSTGAYVLAESYLYTVEAFEDFLDHLDDGGLLSVVVGDPLYRGEDVPPPLATRLALVAREALARRGASDPAAHIAIAAQRVPSPFARPGSPITGALRSDLLVTRAPFTHEELASLREFLEPRGFELYLDPERRNEPTTARLLDTPEAGLETALAQQSFALEPTTDDKPFFYHVLRWQDVFRGAGILWFFPGSTVGQIMLLIMLGQALLVGSALIFLPLRGTGTGALSRREAGAFLIYFMGLGLGFLLVEISFVQKYVLLLGYPTYSLSVTIFSLLVFAALGAWLSQRFWARPRSFLPALLALTVALVVLETLALPALREGMLAASLPARIGVTVLLQLPLGTCLGMYFPTGVHILGSREPRLVPWAWAVNGVGSVVASVLAVILGMAIGFSGVALVAAGVYGVGTLALISTLRAAPSGA